METAEGTSSRTSKRRCIRRDKDATISTPQNETPATSFFPGSFLSPAARATASNRPSSTARTCSTSADYGRGGEQNVATPKTKSPPYKGAFHSAPRHPASSVDMAKQQFALMQSLRDASQGSRAFVDALQEPTDLAAQTGDRQADLVALAHNALKVMKNVKSGGNEQARPEERESPFDRMCPTLHHDRLMELLRQRHTLSAGCEGNPGTSVYRENDEEKLGESPFRQGETARRPDFLRLGGDDSQQRGWTRTVQGLSHYDTVPRARHPEASKTVMQPGEAHSRPQSDPRDILHFQAVFPHARNCSSPSPEGRSLRPQCVAGANDNSVPAALFHSTGGASHRRAESPLASFATLLCSASKSLPAGARGEASSRQAPQTSPPDVLLQTLRTLMSLSALPTTPVPSCNLAVSAGPSEKDFSAASVENLSALLRAGNAAATAATATSSPAAGVCATSGPDAACEHQRTEVSSTSFCGGVPSSAQNLLYTLLMSCGTGHHRQMPAEREGAAAASSTSASPGRDIQRYSALTTKSGGHASHSRVPPAAQNSVSTPPHLLSSCTSVELTDLGNPCSSAAEYNSGSSVAGESFAKTQHGEPTKELRTAGRGGSNCSLSGLLPKKSDSIEICRSASEDSAQITPADSNYSSLRRRGSLLIATDKDTSPRGIRSAAGDASGVSRGRSRTENLTRTDSMTKAESRSEGTTRAGNSGRARGRYTGGTPGGESSAPGALGRGSNTISAGGASGCKQENETGKPDVTLGGNRPHYHVAKQEWRVRYYLNGKRKMRTYSAKFYGYEAAHSMATDFAQYVDKNEALPHPVCKPVGLGGGRGAAALSAAMTSRALSAAAPVKEGAEHSDAPTATRYATSRHENTAEQPQIPLRLWESDPTAAFRSLEALRLTCSEGAKAANWLPQQAHGSAAVFGAASIRATGGGCDTVSVDGESSPAATRLGCLSRTSTPLFQASATPSDEDGSPYHNRSLSSNIDTEREHSICRNTEMQEESALQQKYSFQDLQATTPTTPPSVDFTPEMTLAHFLKSRKRRSPSVCCLGSLSSANLTATTVVPPVVAETEEEIAHEALRGCPLDIPLRARSPAVGMAQGAAQTPEEAKSVVVGDSAADTTAGTESFLEGLQEREKMYLSKLFSSVLLPIVTPQQPPTGAPEQERAVSTSSLERISASTEPAALRSKNITTATAETQTRCGLLLRKQDRRCILLQTDSPSVSSLGEDNSTRFPLVSKSDGYAALAEAAAAPPAASACSMANELMQSPTSKTPLAARVGGEGPSEDMGPWLTENHKNASRDTRAKPEASTDCEEGLGGGSARTGAETSTVTLKAANVSVQAPLTRIQIAGDGPIRAENEKVVAVAPGHATATMLAKTAMSQQMLDTVMLFDEFIRGFEKEFSAKQLQQQRRAILTPARFAPEVSAWLPSLASSPVTVGGKRKISTGCDGPQCQVKTEEIDTLLSGSLSHSSSTKNAKDLTRFTRERYSVSDISRQLESFLQTGAVLSASLASYTPAAMPEEGVSRMVSGLRLQLGSSELLVLSRVLVELTSSTYVLVTTLRATLASSTDIVQNHCSHLTHAAADTVHSGFGFKLHDATRKQRGRETVPSVVANSDGEERADEVQQTVSPRVLGAASREHNGEVARQQHHEDPGEQQHHVGMGKAQVAAERAVLTFNAAAKGRQGSSCCANSREGCRRVQRTDAGETIYDQTSCIDATAGRDVTDQHRGSDTEARSDMEATSSGITAAQADVENGEKRDRDASWTGVGAFVPRKDLRLDEDNWSSKAAEPTVLSRQTPSQVENMMKAPNKLQISAALSSISATTGHPSGESEVEDRRMTLKEAEGGSSVSAAGHIDDNNFQTRSSKVTRGSSQSTEEEYLELIPCRSQHKAPSAVQQSGAEQARKSEGQQASREEVRGPAETKGAAAEQEQPREACERGDIASRERYRNAVHTAAQESGLREQSSKSQLQQQQQGGDDVYKETLRMQPQQQNYSETFSSFSARKDSVDCSCTDTAAVLHNIATLLQSQQRLVSLIKQLQGSLPQYLRLIIRVAGHCFLPYKLPPATYFIQSPGLTARGAGAGTAAAANAAALSGETLCASETQPASAPGGAETALQPTPVGSTQRRCSLEKEEALLMHPSGAGAMAPLRKGTCERHKMSLETEGKQTLSMEKAAGGELQGKAKLGGESPERPGSCIFLSRQSSVSGYPACGAATSASSTEVDYNCSDSAGPPAADTERKLSRDTTEEEMAVPCACRDALHCGATMAERSGKKGWECADRGAVNLADANVFAHYTSDQKEEAANACSGTQYREISVAETPPVEGPAAVPYVQIPGGRMIQNEAELEVFLLRPFLPAACTCQERPCPCERQHIADLIHMLYTLPRPCDEADIPEVPSLSAASATPYAPPHPASGEANGPAVCRESREGSATAASRIARATSSQAGAQQQWVERTGTTQDSPSATATFSMQEGSGGVPDISDCVDQRQKSESFSHSPVADLSAAQEEHPASISTSNNGYNARSKSYSGIASSRTTSSGSSSSSSESSLLGSDALVLVEESLRQVLFAEKLADCSSGSASSTHALSSASASPFCGPQSTGSPQMLLSAAETPGTAFSCAGSPFQGGSSAASAAALYLLREAARQSAAPPAGEDKMVAAGRDGKTTGAEAMTSKGEEEPRSGNGQKRRKLTGCVDCVDTSAPELANPGGTARCPTVKDEASVASTVVTLPVAYSEGFHGPTAAAGESTLTPAACLVLGAERIEEKTTTGKINARCSTATGAASDEWRRRPSADNLEGKELVDGQQIKAGAAERPDGDVTASPTREEMQDVPVLAVRAEGSKEMADARAFDRETLAERNGTSTDPTSAERGNGIASRPGSAPSKGAEAASAEEVEAGPELAEEGRCLAPSEDMTESGEGYKRSAETAEVSEAAAYETVAAALTGETASGPTPASVTTHAEKPHRDTKAGGSHPAAAGGIDNEQQMLAATSTGEEQVCGDQLSAVGINRATACSAETSCTSCRYSENLQHSGKREKEISSALDMLTLARQQAVENRGKSSSEEDNHGELVLTGGGAVALSDQRKLHRRRAEAEVKEEKGSKQLDREEAVQTERPQTSSSVVQEWQSLLLQEKSAALLNRSYPTVLASILPLQSLAHTIARLILHLHRQLICRFIGAHAGMLLNAQKGHVKAGLNSEILRHLVRQLIEADAGFPVCNSRKPSNGGNSDGMNGNSCRSSCSAVGSVEDSASTTRRSRETARVSLGPGVSAENCAVGRTELLPQACSTAINVLVKTAAGRCRLGGDFREGYNEGLKKTLGAGLAQACSAPGAGALKSQEKGGQGAINNCDASTNSPRWTERGRATPVPAIPAEFSAPLQHSSVGENEHTKYGASGTPRSFHGHNDVAAAVVAKMRTGNSWDTPKKRRGEHRGGASFLTYADILRAAATVLGDSHEAAGGQSTRLSPSREIVDAPALSTADGLRDAAFHNASRVEHGDAISLSACSGTAERRESCCHVSSTEASEKATSLSRLSTTARGGSACEFLAVNDSPRKAFDSKAAELSQLLVRAHSYYVSRGAAEKSTAATRTASTADHMLGNGVAETRGDDNRPPLLSFSSAEDITSSDRGHDLY